jgi:hypothetical protein
VALGVFNELVEGVVGEGDLVDDAAGADGGVVVAADFFSAASRSLIAESRRASPGQTNTGD